MAILLDRQQLSEAHEDRKVRGGNEMSARWSRALSLIALAIYVAMVVILELHHEPWRDEADPWLLARDADLFTFFHRMGLSGTPGLWHALLVPFARTGLPYASQAVLHILIASCTAALILWKGPFPLVLRIMTIYSYYLSYEYS